MAIRLRTTKDGVRIALNAKSSNEKLGDVFLSDSDQHALAALIISSGMINDGQFDETLEAAKKEPRLKQSIKCACCGELTKISKIDLIQTYHYIQPYGCSGGDYSVRDEVNYICPHSSVRNRLLFDTYDIPWIERDKFENDPQAQFVRLWSKKFASVVDEHNGHADRTILNSYIDENRRGFGLVERIKKKKS